MADATGLYRDILLDHARHPRRSGRLEHPDLTGTAHNPLCGDRLEVTVALADGTIQDLRGAVRGCVIAQASCSLMAELVAGKPLAEALALGEALRLALDDPAASVPPSLEALAPLVEVRRHRSRIGCALLPWQALADARKA